MSKTTNALKCDGCGKFIADAEFERGAKRTLITPDSALTFEEWETLCAKCNTPQESR